MAPSFCRINVPSYRRELQSNKRVGGWSLTVEKRFAWLHGLVVFAGVLLVYWFTLPREITFEDAGLFQMVCHLGGIGHPPGYPLFTLLCKPFVGLPIWGEPSVLPGNLLSALFASACVAVFHQICFRLTGDRLVAYCAAFAYGFSATFWSQAIIIEVYTLAALMFMISWRILIAFDESRSNRYWYLFCGSVGLALSNHWPLMVLSMPALVAFAWPMMTDLMDRARAARFWLLSVLCFAAGLTPYLSLVIDQSPEIAMIGAPSTLEEFAEYINRSIYSDSDAAATGFDRVLIAGWLLRESILQMGVVGVVFILPGVAASVRRLPLHYNVSLLLLWVGTTFVLNLLLEFQYDFDNLAIFKPYPIIAWASVAFLYAMGVRSVTDMVSRWLGNAERREYLHAMVIVVAISVVLFSNFATNDRHEDRVAANYGRAVLASVPPDSLVLLNGDHEVHVVGYLRLVEGIRQDVEVRHWADLLFANRLGNPLDGEEEKRERIKRFVSKTDRPVVSLSDIVRPAVDYGLLLLLDRGGTGGYGITPELLVFRDHVLQLYGSGYLRDPYEKMLAVQWIVSFARHHVGWRRADPGCPRAVCGAIDRLGQTFPGKLGILEASVGHVTNAAERGELLSLAEQALGEVPSFIRKERLAYFYELYGRLLLDEPGETARAVRFFERSIDAWPAPRNRSICQLRNVLHRIGKPTELIEQRFPGAACK